MLSLLAASALLQVQVRDEAKDWKLITTEHFNVYYPADELLPRAREFAAWFEQARRELSETMGGGPPRIHVFLYRSFHDLQKASYVDTTYTPPLMQRVHAKEPRGRAPSRDCLTCRPNSKSRALALAEPLRDRIFIHCQPSDRWNYWFLKHELSHQFQFEHLYAFRLPSWMIALKDPIIPQWWWEGGADYWAGIFDTEKDEWVRDLANERLYDLKELHTPDILPPYDFLAVYYQGSYFWRFLDEQYGAGTARQLYERTDTGLPLASQKPLQNVVGKGRVEIERDFHDNLQTRWAPMMLGRGVPTERLTDSREYYRRRSSGGRWSPDGKHLAWLGNSDVVPDLYVDGSPVLGADRSVDGSRLVSIPSWSPDGKRLAVIEQRTHRDLLLLADVGGGSETIELPFDELYDPAWSPDGGKIAFAALKAGTSDLYVLNLADRRIERLTNDAAGDSAPAWSPDGRLAWIKEVEGRTLLYVDGKDVTKSWALLEYPQWAPDGKSIVLSADVGGVYDAFSVDPATGQARRLTKFRGGVSYPAWHPNDGTLLITYFEGRGTDLYRVRPEAQDEPRFDEEERKPWYEPFKKPEPQGVPAEKTRVFGVDWLQFPVSSYSLLLPGAEFQLSDRDAENRLTMAGYGLGSKLWGASAGIQNSRWRPNLGVVGAAGRSGDLLEARVTPYIDVPLWNTLEVGAGWTARERNQYYDEPPQVRVFDSGPTFSALFLNERSVSGWDPSWGFSMGGSASLFSEEWGGDRELNEYFTFFETSHWILDQDLILWFRGTWDRLVGRRFLEDEPFKIETLVRGAIDLEGLEAMGGHLELRFPIYRDFLWKPLELFGLGEWLLLKDLRGFAFGDAGRLVSHVGGFARADFRAFSAGAGLRLDFSFMLWPLVNARVPVRLEGWWAYVTQDFEPDRGTAGGGFSIGF